MTLEQGRGTFPSKEPVATVLFLVAGIDEPSWNVRSPMGRFGDEQLLGDGAQTSLLSHCREVQVGYEAMMETVAGTTCDCGSDASSHIATTTLRSLSWHIKHYYRVGFLGHLCPH